MPQLRGAFPYKDKPSEARDILNALINSGMERRAIAAALSLKTETLRSIQSGKSSGASNLARLRGLYEASRVRFPDKLPALPVRAAAAPAPVVPPVDESTVAVAADIEAADQPPDERTTGERVRGKLHDFLLGKDGAAAVIEAAEAKQGGKKSAQADSGGLDERQARFVEQLAPILGLAIVIAGDLAWRDPYKAVCAPTTPEGEAIVRPILRIAARQLEITGNLSDNTVDVLASLAAVAVYADRSWTDYRRMREAAQTQQGGNARDYDGRAAAGTGYPYAPPPPAYGVASSGIPSGSGGIRARGDAGQSARAPTEAAAALDGIEPTDEQRRSTALLDGVLQQDAIGRRQLALN